MDDTSFAVNLKMSSAKSSDIEVKEPLKLERDAERAFVRLDLAEQVEFTLIKESGGQFYPDGAEECSIGSALHISESGLLLDSADLAPEGSLLALTFTAQGDIQLSNTLGVVKRIDQVDGQILAGISFVSREELRDHLSTAELELLSVKFGSFTGQLEQVLKELVTDNSAE